MTFTPRSYQIKLDADTDVAWSAGHRNIIAVSPTGSGKTKFMGMKARKLTRPGVAIAHRKELVGQISQAMAELGVYHRIIGADGTVRNCVQRHINGVGQSYVNPRANFTVASVDTLLNRADDLKQWASEVGLWMIDEAHHVLQCNKWGKAAAMFTNAYGLGVTATPIRADKKSLHVDQGGMFSAMVLGPTPRQLIDEGALCEYRIFAPPASIDRGALQVGSTGDFTSNSLRKVAHESKIVGDIVEHYRKIADRKRAICFVVDVEQAKETAEAFRQAGYRAEAVDANTPEGVRDAVIGKFATGKVDILVNVDLFGEGFDVPAVEVVIMGRPTESYGLYVQQFGRALRPLAGKSHGIIIDHVGNVRRHGLPDAPRVWSLRDDNWGKKKERDPNVMPVTTCVNPDIACFKDYPAYLPKCPFCGYKPIPAGRSKPEQVEGDLVELDPEVLAQMRGEAQTIMSLYPGLVTDPRTAAMRKNWDERRKAQEDLRYAMSQWAWPHHVRGETDSEIMRRFYIAFGIDVLSAQALGTKEAEALFERIMGK